MVEGCWPARDLSELSVENHGNHHSPRSCRVEVKRRRMMRDIPQHRRRDIFVVVHENKIKAPSGAASSVEAKGYVAPAGLEIFIGIVWLQRFHS
jgi:hypothetical protein